MKVKELLERLSHESAISVTEERSLPDGKAVLTFSTKLPFPKVGPAWYSMVVQSEDEDIAPEKIEALLRHLWMLQLDITKKTS